MLLFIQELPTFWRAEIWHPLSVHFPIALLIFAAFMKVVALFSTRAFWREAGSFLLYSGTVGTWISIFTGDLADGEVARSLCDPTVLKDHENLAYYMGDVYIFLSFWDVNSYLKIINIRKRLQEIVLLAGLVVGSVLLVYVGHLGASLVYQQGAGVYKPSADCIEFVE